MRPKKEEVSLVYRDHNGSTRIAVIYPLRVFFDTMKNETHKQWLLQWWDKNTNTMNYTPMASIIQWAGTGEATLEAAE